MLTGNSTFLQALTFLYYAQIFRKYYIKVPELQVIDERTKTVTASA